MIAGEVALLEGCSGSAGSNSFRISIEWARIVPERGVVDEEAVKHYHRIFDQIDACALFWPSLIHHGVVAVVHRATSVIRLAPEMYASLSRSMNVRMSIHRSIRCTSLCRRSSSS